MPAAETRRSPSWADLGLHKLALLLLLVNGAVVGATVPFYGTFGLTIDWQTFWPSWLAIGIALIAWLAHATAPGRPPEWPVAESFVAFILLAICFAIVAPAQYIAVALQRPLADPWLARADGLLGIHVPALVQWTREFPVLVRVFQWSYFSLIAQFVLAVVALGLFYRDRDALWEYAFNFHICLVLTLIGLALFPAICAFTYYGFDSLLDQSRFISHFDALRRGTFRLIRLQELQGLITFPSFHVAGGLMVTWAFRKYRRMFTALVVVNVLNTASTVFLGAHYAVDILASLALFALSTWIYSRWAHRLIATASAVRKEEPPAVLTRAS